MGVATTPTPLFFKGYPRGQMDPSRSCPMAIEGTEGFQLQVALGVKLLEARGNGAAVDSTHTHTRGLRST